MLGGSSPRLWRFLCRSVWLAVAMFKAMHNKNRAKPHRLALSLTPTHIFVLLISLMQSYLL